MSYTKPFTTEERAKVRTTIECTSYTKPLTPEEREQVLQRARRAMRSEDDGLEGLLDLQWDATLRAVEEERNELLEEIEAVQAFAVAVEAERDALAEDLAEVTADRDSWRRYCAQHS